MKKNKLAIYLLTNPAGKGTSTLWYSSYWEFIKQYLEDRFEEDYCLSPESSLNLISGQNIIPKQIIVLTKKKSNQTIDFPHGTSVLFYTDAINFPKTINKQEGINTFPLAEALCKATPNYFKEHSLNAEICMKLVASTAELSRVLLSKNLISAAERIAGGYKQLGDIKRSQQIGDDLAASGRQINLVNPFDKSALCLSGIERLTSPYAGRIEALWNKMREDVITNFPKSHRSGASAEVLISTIEELYREDTYHSLSIEGYQVTEDLIDRIKKGQWSPDQIQTDSEQKNALAAKGYLNAFKSVLESVKKVVVGKSDAADVMSDDLQAWYRNTQVYISGSRYVPPPVNAVLDCMETLEKLLKKEESPAVRAILGHFIFGYIHPYIDGNGRIGRFIMNLMLISGGYNWTVIRSSERIKYLSSLEAVSSNLDISLFTQFVASEMKYWASQYKKEK